LTEAENESGRFALAAAKTDRSLGLGLQLGSLVALPEEGSCFLGVERRAFVHRFHGIASFPEDL